VRLMRPEIEDTEMLATIQQRARLTRFATVKLRRTRVEYRTA